MIRSFMIFSILLGVTSCASFSKSRLSNLPLVHLYQSQEKVLSILGSPKERVSKGEVDLWYYDLLSDDSGKSYPYTAKFESGMLKSIAADYSRSAADRELCQQRKSSNQALIPFVGGNGAPTVSVDCAD